MLRPSFLILSLSLLAVPSTGQQQGCSSNLQADIVFMLDQSGSVGKSNFKMVLDFVRAIVNSFVIGPNNVQIGIGTFGSSVYHVLKMNRLIDNATVFTALDALVYRGGVTRTHLALKSVRTDFFTKESGDRDTAPNYLIFVADGRSTQFNLTQTEAEELSKTDITVFAIGVGKNIDQAELQLIASAPDLVFNVSNFAALTAIEGQLVQDVCEGPRTTPSTPGCSPNLQADIVFMLDQSGSVGKSNFKMVLDFVRAIVNSFVIGPNNVQIGIGTFGSGVYDVITMNGTSDNATVFAALDSLVYNGGTTQTHLALKSVRTVFFTKENGDRDTAPNYLIFVADGRSTQFNLTHLEAEELSKTDITVFAIGVGKNIDQAELQLIASAPDLVFNVSNFAALTAIEGQLVQDVCEAKPTTTPGETTCKVIEIFAKKEIRYVRIECEVNNVYPEAVCKFYRRTDGGSPVPITAQSSYTHTKSQGGPYFKTFCSVNVQLPELGEGTHTFQAYCFPDVPNGERLVNVTSPTKTVRLVFPRATHTCPPNLLNDYLCGRPTACNCTLTSQGRPRGYAGWYNQAQIPIPGPAVLKYDSKKPNVLYTCQSRSALGAAYGSTLRVDMETTCN